MENVIRPLETELSENELQHLEMVVLLIADNINVAVKLVFGESPLGSSEVLGHIHRSSVAPEQEFSVKPVRGKVTPYGTVRILHEHAHIQSLLNQFLAEEICLGLEIRLVE